VKHGHEYNGRQVSKESFKDLVPETGNTGKPMNVTAAAALGIGFMVDAGIFALMGVAGSIAGSAVYLSFIIAGIVALLSGYSMARLGARYPSAGGLVEYLAQGFGVGLFSSALSILLYLSALIALALVAKTFGNYAVTLLPVERSTVWVNGMVDFTIIALVLINLEGAKSVALTKNIIVGIKLLVLVGFSITGLVYARPELLFPAQYPDIENDSLQSDNHLLCV